MNRDYPFIDSVEKLQEEILRVKKAQALYATYTQEQVDRIFLAAATAANKARIPLAKAAVAETGMGIVEDKVIKNHFASEYIYNAYRNTKTCGVIEEDAAYGIRKIAEPLGLICAIIPTTNPTSTAIFKTLLALKTRNGIIISPHHRAKSCTVEAAKLVLEAAVAAGAPEDIIGWINMPSRDMTGLLMKQSDVILATGGPSMVNAAYSSGTPALGVGAGNTPAVIDESADILLAVNSIIHSKAFDNGMICRSAGICGARLLLPQPRGDRETAQNDAHQRLPEREDRRPEAGHHRRARGLCRARGDQDPDRRGGVGRAERGVCA